MEKLQSASILLTPGLYESMWRRGSSGSLFDYASELSLLQDLMLSNLEKNGSKIVICTHIVPFGIMAALKRQNYLDNRQVYGVVTDYGLNNNWPINDIDGYFVGHEELRQMLIFRGVDPEKVHTTGIPLRLNFEKASWQPLRLPSGNLHILFIAGGLQSGSYVEIQQYVAKLIMAVQSIQTDRIHLTIITGRQEKLFKKLSKFIGQTSFDVNVLGFIEDMYTLMSEHDILIGKPGGLLVSEALALGMCFIPVRPGPGQETANLEFLARHGAATYAGTPEKMAQILTKFLDNPGQIANIQERAKSLGKPHSARDLVQFVLTNYQQAFE
jgi:processive 1,2-diacylglycerol beta-glucosyltransferase